MLIYNVTTKVAHPIAADWLRWMKEEHIPDLVQTGCFTRAVILHLLENDDEEGVTYAVQYHSPSQDDYRRYLDQHAETMRKKAIDRWKDQVISFRTLMKVVH